MKKTDRDRPKSFDCLAYKDQVQSEIYEETKNLSHEELTRYFRQAAERGPLAEFWKKIPKKNRQAGLGEPDPGINT